MKHLYFISLVFLILSCNNQDKLNLEKEVRILEEKTEYFKSKLDLKYYLNPEKIRIYSYLQKNLDLQFEKIELALGNNDYEIVNSHLTELIELVEANKIFQSYYIQKIIIPSRTNQWINKVKKIDKKDYMKLDLLKLQCELIEYLYHDIENDYFKFNRVIPMIVDSSNTVKKGEIYKAEIMLAAYDSTQAPNFYITDLNQDDSILYNLNDNKYLFDSLLVLEGKGIYNANTRTIGKKGFKGIISIKDSDGNGYNFPFVHTYTVIDK